MKAFLSYDFYTKEEKFRTSEQFYQEFIKANKQYWRCIGKSDEGRDIYALIIGRGPLKISLLAGCHSDEPVGPETLRWLSEYLLLTQKDSDLLDQFSFYIVPHINPDGEMRNRFWLKNPSFENYIKHVFREKPGRDIEFGFPDMRSENCALSYFYREHGPFDLHMSLHGMGYSEGPMLLIEKNWIERTKKLRERFSERVLELGYRHHDHDRKGDKGFEYISPGYWSTPEGTEMQKHFLKNNNSEMASKFKLSSMEYVRTLGQDTLCLVTELPLFCIGVKHAFHNPVHTTSYFDFKKEMENIVFRPYESSHINRLMHKYKLKPFGLKKGMSLQVYSLNLALSLIQRDLK